MATLDASTVSQSTCSLHPMRPASARCPSCSVFYCSECITEHEGRLTCAKCLSAESAHTESKGSISRFFQLMPVLHLLLAVAAAWVIFYLLAQTILEIPHDFHNGTIWE